MKASGHAAHGPMEHKKVEEVESFCNAAAGIWRIPGKTAIPVGSYVVEVTYSVLQSALGQGSGSMHHCWTTYLDS
jgi:hypothetical protein